MDAETYQKYKPLSYAVGTPLGLGWVAGTAYLYMNFAPESSDWGMRLWGAALPFYFVASCAGFIATRKVVGAGLEKIINIHEKRRVKQTPPPSDTTT